MRNTKKQILLGFLFSWVLTQQAYRSVESIQSEWNEYTSYQKDERVSFCDFLFKEGHYERCLLTAFQLLYQFPDDPYMITFRGYAQMKKLKWEEARLSFINAQALFNHSHYNKLMGPLYQTIENVGSVPRHNRYLVFLSGSLMPGGGQFMLREWDKGQGILTSVGLMVLIGSWGKVESFVDGNRFIDSEGTSIPLYNNYEENNSHKDLANGDQIPKKMNVRSSSLKYSIPPLLIGAGIFIGSTWKSFIDTQTKNERLVEFYIEERIDKISPSRFLDFPEPTLIVTEE